MFSGGRERAQWEEMGSADSLLFWSVLPTKKKFCFSPRKQYAQIKLQISNITSRLESQNKYRNCNNRKEPLVY